jgi:hypothetical protein
MIVHALGAVIVAAGLFLFAWDQIKGSKAASDESGVSAKGLGATEINLSGPPALILVVVGVLVFMFPLTPWGSGSSGHSPSVPPTGTEAPTTPTTQSTGVPPAVTNAPPLTSFEIPPATFPPLSIPDFQFELPAPLLGWFTYTDICGEVVEWDSGNFAETFYVVTITVQTYDGIYVDGWQYESVFNNICVADFWYGPDLVHLIEVIPVNDWGWGEPLVIEWFS